MDPATVDIDEFLKEEGFDTPAALKRARSVLDDAQVSNSRKARMSTQKLPHARSLLLEKLLKTCCPECENLLSVPERRERIAVGVSRSHCQLCGGSEARKAIRALADRLEGAGLENLLIIGGTPRQHAELRDLTASTTIKLRLVEGSKRVHRQQDADANLKWAQIVAIWCPTPLSHKVSKLYDAAQRKGAAKIMVNKRGIASLCGQILEKLSHHTP